MNKITNYVILGSAQAAAVNIGQREVVGIIIIMLINDSPHYRIHYAELIYAAAGLVMDNWAC